MAIEGFKVENLSYAYNSDVILKNIYLDFNISDFLAIIGENGGGKTTFIKLILGLLPSKNHIFFNNLNPLEIGYVPQLNNTNKSFHIRVIEVVLMGLLGEKTIGFYTKKNRELALESLDKVGIGDLWDRRLDELSGGQRQRVFIARALVGKCKLIILDEPTASLDSKSAVAIFEILKALNNRGVGIIVVCHNINLVLAYANNIAYLNRELILHKNEQSKSGHIKHLYENHQHFCDVEMSLESCLCGDK